MASKTRCSVLLLIASGVLAACGGTDGPTRTNDSARGCALSIAPRSNELRIERAIGSVLRDSVDPCGGAAALSQQNCSAEFVRVAQSADEAAPYLRLVFRVQLVRLDTGPTARQQME